MKRIIVVAVVICVAISIAVQFPRSALGDRYATRANTSSTVLIPYDRTDSRVTIRNLEQFSNFTQSADVIDGFQISKNVAEGTVDVTGGHAVLRCIETSGTDSQLKVFHIDGVDGLAIPNKTSTYLYADYNAGSPKISTTSDPATINNTNEVAFGWVFRNGTDYQDVFQAGPTIQDFVSRWVTREFLVKPVHRCGGARISIPGGYAIKSTAGCFYSVLALADTGAIDTSIAEGSFTTAYRSGSDSWTRTHEQLVIDHTKYNDLTTNTLADISPASKFGIGWFFWVFNDPARLIFVYGQNQYNNAGDAIEAAQRAPTIVPPELNAPAVSYLAASVYWKANGSDFIEALNRERISFTPAIITDHNDLANLQGGQLDEYYHLTQTRAEDLDGQSQETILNDRASPVNLGSRAYDPATYRGFRMVGQIAIDADTDVFQSTEVWAIWNGTSFDVSQADIGGASVVNFSVTNAGQIQYTSDNFAGFVSGAFSLSVQPFIK